MTRLIEINDTHRDEAELVEPAFRKLMLRIDRLADDEAKRQRLIIEMLEWLNSELDGEVLIITYEAVSK